MGAILPKVTTQYEKAHCRQHNRGHPGFSTWNKKEGPQGERLGKINLRANHAFSRRISQARSRHAPCLIGPYTRFPFISRVHSRSPQKTYAIAEGRTEKSSTEDLEVRVHVPRGSVIQDKMANSKWFVKKTCSRKYSHHGFRMGAFRFCRRSPTAKGPVKYPLF